MSLLDPNTAAPKHILGARQLTDLYLLALTVRHKGQFATFDAKIPLAAIPGATRRHLQVL